jgi:hypothetical protein
LFSGEIVNESYRAGWFNVSVSLLSLAFFVLFSFDPFCVAVSAPADLCSVPTDFDAPLLAFPGSTAFAADLGHVFS